MPFGKPGHGLKYGDYAWLVAFFYAKMFGGFNYNSYLCTQKWKIMTK